MPGTRVEPASRGGPTVTFRFYEELNDFLAPDRRRRDFTYACARAATAKHAIEALGVPHTEVEIILVDGHAVGFDHVLREGERVSVYPVFEAFDVTPLVRLRERPLREPRFAADAHLGGLARLLRMLGFDTVFRNDVDDEELLAESLAGHRIVLTRDRELLKRRELTHGCFVHALEPKEQLAEVVRRLQLALLARPFSRCLHCNVPLEAVEKEAVIERLPPRVAESFERFSRCPTCGRIYWEGSHWERMRAMLAATLE